MRGGRKRQATTLIELLVVIGIIGVLISMLLPSLKRTMQLAASTVCMHNLREIGNCLTLYRVENDGWLPTDLSAPEEEPAGSSELASVTEKKDAWFLKLAPTYLADLSVMACPADPYRYRMTEALRGWRMPPDIGDYASYGINSFIMVAGGGRLADLDRHMPTRPLDTVLVTDLGPDSLRAVPGMPLPKGGPRRSEAMAYYDDGHDYHPVGFTTTPWVTRRHGHGINMLTLGGGVRPARTEEVMRLPVRTYYPNCAAGGCSLCKLDDDYRPIIYHYSFARDGLYWWTGALSLD